MNTGSSHENNQSKTVNAGFSDYTHTFIPVSEIPLSLHNILIFFLKKAVSLHLKAIVFIFFSYITCKDVLQLHVTNKDIFHSQNKNHLGIGLGS